MLSWGWVTAHVLELSEEGFENIFAENLTTKLNFKERYEGLAL